MQWYFWSAAVNRWCTMAKCDSPGIYTWIDLRSHIMSIVLASGIPFGSFTDKLCASDDIINIVVPLLSLNIQRLSAWRGRGVGAAVLAQASLRLMVCWLRNGCALVLDLSSP